MVSAPAAIAAEQAMLRQNMTMSVVKAAAEEGQAIANILDQAARSAPVSSTLGSNVNTSA